MEVCKTFIRGFDSRPRLQPETPSVTRRPFTSNPAKSPFFTLGTDLITASDCRDGTLEIDLHYCYHPLDVDFEWT